MSRFARWIALLIALGGASGAFAQAPSPLSGFCTQGGTSAKVSGLPSTNFQQGIIPSCTVTVYVHGWQTPTTASYQSGGTVAGTQGQTCSVTFSGGSPTGGGIVTLTGTNTVAANTPIQITSWGNYASPPTTATLGNGTATCSGAATITSSLGPSLATIFSDGSSTPLSNPFTGTTKTSLAPGSWTFWASATQSYDVVFSGGIVPNVYASPITGLVGVSPSSAGNYLPLAGGTLYGALFAPNINGEMYPAACGRSPLPSWCSGSTPDAWFRAACTQLPSSGGTINLLGLTGTATGPFTCSTPTKQVITLQDPTSEIFSTQADGGVVFPQDNGSMFLGPGAGQCGNNGGIHLTASSNVAGIVGPAHTDGSQEAFTANGLCVFGHAGETVSQGLIFTSSNFTNTTISYNNAFVCANTSCYKVLNGDGQQLVGNWANVTDGITGITGTPLTIQGSGLGNGCNLIATNVSGGQYEHALGGGPEINVVGDGSGLTLLCDVHIHDIGIERNPSGTASTVGISVADCKNCSVENVVESGNPGGTSMIQITQNFPNAIYNVVLRNISDIFGSYTNTLNDTTTNGIVLPFSVQPFITTYYANPGYVQPPVLPGTTIQSVGADLMGGLGSFTTGSGNFGTGFIATGCLPSQGFTCVYTRTSSTAPPGQALSQEVQMTGNTDPSVGFSGIQYNTLVSFVAGNTYEAIFWAKGDGTFSGLPTFLLWDSVSGTQYCKGQSPNPFPGAWTLYSFICTPNASGSSYLTVSSQTPVGVTGTFWFGGFVFAPVQPLSPGNFVSVVTPYGIGTSVNGASIGVGLGAPTSTCGTAPTGSGSLWLRTDGGASTTLYVCNGTTWTAK